MFTLASIKHTEPEFQDRNNRKSSTTSKLHNKLGKQQNY